jgi:hypothetical protein
MSPHVPAEATRSGIVVERRSLRATLSRFMVDLLVVPVSARLRPAGYDADHTTCGSG